jgi:hypothetical protein
MKKFAHLNDDNVVINIFVAESLEIAQQVIPHSVEYTDKNPARIGWIYDGTTYVAPTE